MRVVTALLAVCLLGAVASGGTLPEGEKGIASQYPGDEGIGGDARVVFIENFEEGSVEVVKGRWEDRGGEMSLAADVPSESSGRNSLLMTHVGGKGTGSMLWRRISNKSGGWGYDQLFLRTYVKFAPDCNDIHHFGCSLGGRNPVGPKWPIGKAGIQPTGDDRFGAG